MKQREIKLKAVLNGKIIGQIAVLNLGNLCSVVGSAGNFFIADEIIQYTGLKDKNGVEIYEGDIVEFLYKHPEKSEKLQPVSCEIFWSNEGAWCLKWFDKNRTENSARLNPEKYTVIGNIYESPELLK